MALDMVEDIADVVREDLGGKDKDVLTAEAKLLSVITGIPLRLDQATEDERVKAFGEWMEKVKPKKPAVAPAGGPAGAPAAP